MDAQKMVVDDRPSRKPRKAKDRTVIQADDGSVSELAKPLVWRDIRCRVCGRVLCRVQFTPGCRIEIVCPRCAHRTIFPPPQPRKIEPGNGKVVETVEVVV